MIPNNKIKQPYYFLPFIVFILALFFLFTLLLTIKENVFFSGDGGLKFLMVKQIAKGGSYLTLDLQTPAWVTRIWSQGFYPLKTPFVYDSPLGKIISFPPAYQFLNACFYRLFGFPGIYLVPCISLVILWTWFIRVLRNVGTPPVTIAIALFALVFVSPLTFYGAVYWEHALSILLIFSAVVFLINPPDSGSHTAILGLLSGMSVWIRPEMLLLCMLFVVLVLINNARQKSKINIIFAGSSLATISLFFIFNYVEYRDILGAHSYQLFNSLNLISFIKEKFTFLTHLNGKLIIYFPPIILLYVLVICVLLKKITLPWLISQLMLIVMIFLYAAPFALPNAGGKQWGPRYLLPMIPLVIIALCIAAKNLDKKWLWILPLIFMFGLYINVYLAHETLKDDYAFRVKPGLDFLKTDSCNVVVVQNQFIAQEFAVLFEKKQIFLAENQVAFNSLEPLLKAAGISKIVYMAHDSNYEMKPDNLLTNNRNLKHIGDYQFAEYNLK